MPLWLLNPWVRRAGAVALVALAFWGWLKFVHDPAVREEGKREASQNAAAELNALREADRQATAKQLGELQGIIENYKLAFERSTARADALAQAVSSLAQQRQTVVEGVNRIPDSALHGYIVQQLNLRPVNDLTPGYLPAEERELARCVSDRPLCEQQVKKQEAQIAELREGQQAQQQQIQAQESKYVTLEAGYDRLQGYYTTLANLFPRKKRSAKCLWLWQCSTKKLPTPEPLSLQKPEAP